MPLSVQYFAEPSDKMPSVATGSVDFLLCDHAINYFSNAFASMREIRRVLAKPVEGKNGGKVLIVTPDSTQAWENSPKSAKAASALLVHQKNQFLFC